MAWFFRSPWLRSLLPQPVKTIRKKRPRRERPRLEQLEDRTLMASPQPVVTFTNSPNPATPGSEGGMVIGGATNLTVGTNPQLAVNPLDPRSQVVVATDETATVLRGWFSVDSGANWTAFINPQGSPINLPNLPDPAQNGVVPGPNQPVRPVIGRWGQVSSPSVTFDRNNQVYIGYIQRAADLSTGAVVVQKYTFAGATPVNVDLDLANTEIAGTALAGGTPTNTGKIVYRWSGARDVAYNTTVAIDNNEPSYTDPATGLTQTDTNAGGNQTLYVAWNTNNQNTSGGITNFNPNVIMIAASEAVGAVQLGQQFTSPQVVVNGGGSGSHAQLLAGGVPVPNYSAPRIMFRQGAPGGADGGDVIITYNDFANNRVMYEAFKPDGGNALNPGGAGWQFTGGLVETVAGGNTIRDAGVRVQTAVLNAAPANPTNAAYFLTNTLTLNGGTAVNIPSPATANRATLTVSAVGLSLPILTNPGAGYTAGDVLTINGGVSTTQAQITVNTIVGPGPTGPIATFTVSTAGSYTGLPALLQSPAGGTGGGTAQFNLTFNQLVGVTVNNPGAYLVFPTNPVGVTAGPAQFDLTAGGTNPGTADLQTTNTFTVTSTVTDASFIIRDLSVQMTVLHPKLQDLDVVLFHPDPDGAGALTAVTIQLIQNQKNGFDESIDIVGGIIPPSTLAPRGLTGANLGLDGVTPDVHNGFWIGTVFNDNAVRNIRDASFAAPYLATFRPETGSMNAALTAASFGSLYNAAPWELRITDHRNDRITGPPPVQPTQRIEAWRLTLSDMGTTTTTGLGTDRTIPTPGIPGPPANLGLPAGQTTVPAGGGGQVVTGAFDNNYPLRIAAAPAGSNPGVAPSIVGAIDNTLGSFSRYQGRTYIAYTSVGGGGDNTDIYLATSNNLTAANAAANTVTWFNPSTGDQLGTGITLRPLRVNQDAATDNFSEGNRTQLMPAIAVDNTTGTLVMTWYDGRYDAAHVRLANYVAYSITGAEPQFPNGSPASAGSANPSFSFETWMNPTKTATDGIVTTKTIDIEPVPGNQSGTGALGFGERQGLFAYDGKVFSVFASNQNTNTSRIQTANVRIPVGPRVRYDRDDNANNSVQGDYGPIYNNNFTFTAEGGGVTTYNNTYATDGTRQFTGFIVVFDRRVDPATFTSADVVVRYHDTNTQASVPGPSLPVGVVIALNPNALGATEFFVPLAVPDNRVGTYSYSIGPDIQDRIRTVTTSTQTLAAGANTFNPRSMKSIVIGSRVVISDGTNSETVTVTATTPTSFSATTVNPYTNPITIRPLGNLMDQNANGVQGQNFVDQFAAPTPTTGTPFQLPYSTDTLPLIVPGPHVVRVNPENSYSVNSQNAYSLGTVVNPLNIPIPDLGTANSSIFLNGVTGTITGVKINVSLLHSAVRDLRLTLFHTNESGTVSVVLSNQRGPVKPSFFDSNYTNTTFTDEVSAQSLVTGTAPFYGYFVPEASLNAALVGRNPNGEWRLQIDDLIAGDTGMLLHWKVIVDTAETTTADHRVLNKTVRNIDVTFDRDMDATTFTPANIIRVLGPAGPITNAFTITPITSRVFRIGLPYDQFQSGTYTVLVGPDTNNNYIEDNQLSTVAVANGGSGYTVGEILTITGGVSSTAAQLQVTAAPLGVLTGVRIHRAGSYFSHAILSPPNPPVGATGSAGANNATFTLAFGNKVDTNLNAGLNILRGTAATNDTIVAITNTTGPIGPNNLPANTTTDFLLPFPESFVIQGAVVQLNILHSNVPDLDAELIAPDNTTIRLFTGVGGGATPPRANFTNTIFDDNATTAIQLGAPPYDTGPFNPQTPLSVLVNKGSNEFGGVYRLRIINRGATTGTLTYWSLTLNQAFPGSGLGERIADQFTAPFRIFTQDPTSLEANNTWTAVGPASENSGGNTARIGGIAFDPSDPSRNTAYAAGATGGVWKTTDFLNPLTQPTWYPLTDLGPGLSLNIGALGVFAQNNDPNQSIVFAATGEGDTSGQHPGVGFLRSLDGGRNWQVLDSTVNAVTVANQQPGEVLGTILSINDSRRDRVFFGSRAFKIAVDPVFSPGGEVILYAALSGSAANGGIWRSSDTGKTWTRIRAGQADDVVLAEGSAGASGNLEVLYAAFRADGVYTTPNAPTAASLSLMAGGQQLNNRRDIDVAPTTAVPVTTVAANTPNGATKGRIVIATPAFTGREPQDNFYQGWLYAAVSTAGGNLDGLYLTKDFGNNWTRVRIPYTGGLAGNPTNNESNPGTDFDPLTVGPGLPPQGNYDIVLAIDPNDPHVIYLGGQGNNLIRVDTTTMSDVFSMVAYDNSDNDGGDIQFLAGGSGPVTIKAGGTSVLTTGTLGTGNAFGLLDTTNGAYPAPGALIGPYFDMMANPSSPFFSTSSPQLSNIVRFNNGGDDTRWRYFNGFLGGADLHRMVTFKDPLTGLTRVVVGNDHGLWTGVDDGDGLLLTTIGNATVPNRSRNGNMQIIQFYYGAAQPSTLAADLAGSMFYGMAQDDGFPQSTADTLRTGELNWVGTTGDGTGVATDQTGSGTSYSYRWPCCINTSPFQATDFFLVDPPLSGVTNLTSRTNGLLQLGDDPAASAGQWPNLGGSNFAVNPIDGTAILMSSQQGRLFRSAGPTTGTGRTWFEIGSPVATPPVPGATGDVDNVYKPAVAFGAPLTPTAFNDFMYAGGLGRIFVTFNGGGPLQWKNISNGLTGSVQAIVTNPQRGSREAFAVTSDGVFWMADSQAAGNPAWIKLNDVAGQGRLDTARSGSITNATNVGPIVITTSANHGLATGDQVVVQGVLGNTAANGTFTVTVLSPTTYSLIGSTGNGAYTARSGTWRSGPVRPLFNNGAEQFPVINNLTSIAADWRFAIRDKAGSVATATNAGPIVITNTNNHGLVTGEQVLIQGAQGNTAANNLFTVTVVDARTFSLNGSTGNGAYTGSGIWAKAGAINGASNATPIVVTTTANHGLITGDSVTIQGVLGNTAANGTFTITVLTATTFSLNNSIGNGGYISGGTWVINTTHPVLYAAGEGGVYRSWDKGLTWSMFPEGVNEQQTITVGAGVSTMIFSYLDVPGSAVGHNPGTTPSQIQTNLNTIPVLNGNTLVTGPNGGPYVVTFVNQLAGAGNLELLKVTPTGGTVNIVQTTQGIQEGGFMPNARITDLDLALGNIDPASGAPNQSFGFDMLVATTYGRGTFVIRLPQTLPAGFQAAAVPTVAGPRVAGLNTTDQGTANMSRLDVTFNGPGVPEVQRVTITQNSGTFTLQFGAATTNPLNFNATATDVQTALNGLTTIGQIGGSVAVTLLNKVYTVSFQGSLAGVNVNPMVFSGTGPPPQGVTTLTDGLAGAVDPTSITTADISGLTYDGALGTGPSTITGASNATPIVISTTAAHGLVTGNQVRIQGIQGNTAANGVFTVTFVSPTQFSLNGSVGNGTYVGGGTWGVEVDGGTASLQKSLRDITTALAGGQNPHNKYQITFPIQTRQGIYTLRLGPNISDFSGNRMDQNENGVNGEAPANPNGDLFVGSFYFQPFPNNDPDLVAGPPATTERIDEDPLSEVQTVTVNAAFGTFVLALNGFTTTTPLNFNATAAQVQAALNALPSIGGVGGSVAVSLTSSVYTITFGGTLAQADMSDLVATGIGMPTNPVVGTQGTGAPGARNGTNPGRTVNQFLLTSGLTPSDVDAGAVQGIAVTQVNNANGQWQFSVDAGQSWRPFGAIAENTARLLSTNANNRIRFVPTPDFFTSPAGSTVTFQFKAWDFTTGFNGGVADASVTGATAAFSDEVGTARLVVDPINDAPSFTGGPNQSVPEDAGFQLVSNWATNLNKGALNESPETITFAVTVNGHSITNITGLATDPIVVTSIGHGLVDGNQVVITAANPAVNGLTFTVTRVNANNFSLNGSTGADPAVTSGFWRRAITNTTGAGAGNIVITAAISHGLVTGDWVTVSGVNGNTNANGTYQVTVTGATTFSLNDTTNVGTAGAGGTYFRSLISVSPAIFTATAPGTSDIVVTSFGHGLSTGQQVIISGVVGNAGANGTFTVTRLDVDRFSLDTTDGLGLQGAGGFFRRVIEDTNGAGLGNIVITSTAHGLANGDRVAVFGVIGNPNANGTWTVASATANTFELQGSTRTGIAGAGGTWFRVKASHAPSISGVNGNLTFTPLPGVVGSIDITTILSDDALTDPPGGPIPAPRPQSSAAYTFTITVLANNDAPIGANGANPPAGASVNATEDIPYPFVEADFGFTDPNDSPSNLLFEVRITTLNLPLGSTLRNNGVDVTAGQFIPLADIQGGLLVFTPPLDFTGVVNATTPAFTFQVRDDGGILNGGVDLDQTPRNMTINVAGVNDAPRMANGFPVPVPGALGEDNDSTGQSVATLLATGGLNYFDPDTPGPGSGMAVIGVTGNGVWQYSPDGVAAYQPFPAVSATSAFLLPSAAFVRFSPDRRNGETATFTFRGWDTSTGTALGPNVNPTPNGAATAFSTQTATASITIASVNDAPVITGGATLTITGTNEDATSPATLVSTILASGALGHDPIDTSALTGIAITVKVGNNANGWEYSTNGVSGWTSFGAVALNSALLLSSTTSVRYTPDGINGETASFNFRAWDQTTGTASVNGAPSTADPGVGGGITAYSTGSATASMTVTPINDAPTIDPGETFTILPAITEDDANSVSVAVATLIAPANSNLVDNDGPLTGIAVTGVSALGTWEYFVTSTWRPFPVVSPASSLLLSSSTLVRYRPNAQNGETATFTYRGWDQFAGFGTASTDTADGTGNTTTNGANTAFSSNTGTVSIVVNAINDAPVLAAIEGATLAYTENQAATQVTATLTVNDVDNANLTAATVSITSGFASGQDVLAATVTGTNIVANYTPGTGVLDLTGSDTLVNYQIVLRSVTYFNSSDTPSTTNRVVTFRVNDGQAANNLSNLQTRTISVAAANDAPTISSGITVSLAATDEDTTSSSMQVSAILAAVGLNYADVDGPLQGIVVPVTSALGNWQYSETGAVWTNFPAVSAAASLLLASTSFVRYQPNLQNGETATFTFRGWDRATGTASIDGTPGTASTAAPGGTSAFSSNTSTVSIVVNPINDAPVLAAIEGATLAYTENQAATQITASLTVNDVDNANLASATVSITSGFASGQDVLAATVTGTNIVANYTPGTGVLDLTGSDTLVNYQIVLRSVTYFNSSDTPSTTNRVVTFRVNDGQGANNLSNTPTRTISVAAVNDAPVLAAIEGGTLGYTENAAATQITATLTVNDADTANLASATVSITSGFASGQDVLAATVTGTNIVAIYTPGTGVLDLTGSDTLVNYQIVLRSVTYFNSSDNPSTTNRVVTFRVNDGQAANNLSNTQTRTIIITAVNDNPALAAIEGATLGYTENQAATQVTASLTVNDVDNVNLTAATVSITSGFASGQDVLAATVTGTNIVAIYTPGTGVLDLTGSDTLVNYQIVLRSVTYFNSSDNPSTTNRVVTFRVNDGQAANNLSNTQTRTIIITAVNDNPVLAAIEGATLAYTENQAATQVTATLTVNDVDNANLTAATVSITSGFASGQDVLAATVTGTNIVAIYTPGTGVLDLTGSDTLVNYQIVLRSVTYFNSSDNPSTTNRVVTFRVNDGQAANNLSNLQTRTISITAVNDNPVLAAIEGGTLAYTENQAATQITASLTVNDVDNANLASATVSITSGFASGQDVLAATVTGTNILANYTPGTGVLDLTGSDTLVNYQIVLRSVTYFNSSDTPSTTDRVVTFRVNDGQAANNLSNTQTRTISITAVNDNPVLAAIEGTTLSYTENAAATQVTATLTVNDADTANLASATVSITSGFASGQDVLAATVTGTNIVAIYTPGTGVLDLTGSDTLVNYQIVLRSVTYFNSSDNPSTTNRVVTFRVNDGQAANNLSNLQTRTISVAAVNDAAIVDLDNTAVGNDATVSFTEQTSVLIAPNATITDVDGANISSLTASLTRLDGDAFESLSLNAAAETARAGASLTFTYTPSTGLASVTGPPTAILTYQTILRGILYNNTSDNPNPASRSVTVVVSDGVDLSATRTTTINVTPVNDAPVLTGANNFTTITEDQTSNNGDLVSSLVSGGRITDVDGPLQGIAITGVTTGNGGWQYSTNNGAIWNTIIAPSDTSAILVGTSANDRIRFFPNQRTATTATLTFRAWDRSNVPTVPSGTENVNVSTFGNATPYSNTTATANITVTEVNDSPTLSTSPVTANGTDENTTSPATLVSTLLTAAGHDGVDAGALSGVAITAKTSLNAVGWEYSTNGTTGWTPFGAVGATSALLLNSTTSVRYVPNGLNGETATFTFRAWDQTSVETASANGSPSYANPGAGGGNSPYSSASSTANLTVTSVNDAPTAVPNGPYNVAEGGSFTLNGTGSSDPDAGGSITTYDWDIGNNGSFDISTASATVNVTWAQLQSFGVNDGAATVPVVLRVTDNATAQTTSAPVNLNVLNTAPTIALTGANSANEAESYSLTLGAVTDPGADTITNWRINWGDGTPATTGTGNPVGQIRNHVYANEGNFNITVDLQDEDSGAGFHLSAGTKTVTIINVGSFLSGSLADALVVDNNGNLQADVGDIIEYTATITNNGPDNATGVTYSANLDPNQTLVVPTPAAPANTALFSDNFDRTTSTNLGANWTEQFNNTEIDGNRFEGVDGALVNLATVNGVWESDVRLEANFDLTAPGLGTDFNHVGLIARYQGAGNDQNMYLGRVWTVNNIFLADLFRNINGNWVSLGMTSIGAATGVMRFEAIGPALKLFVNNVLVLSTLDSTFREGRVGIRLGNRVGADNFSVSRLASGAFTDNFNRLDSADIGDSYAETPMDAAAGDYAIQNNRLAGVGGFINVAAVTTTAMTDVSVKADINLVGTGFEHAGVIARYQGTGNNNMYAGLVFTFGGGDYFSLLWKSVNGLASTLDFQQVSGPTGNLRLDVVGNALKLYYNDAAVGSAVDSSITGPGLVGVRSSNQTYDNLTVTPLSSNLGFTDNFNRGNSTVLGSHFKESVGDFSVQGNRAVVTGPAFINVASQDDAWYADVSVQADISMSGSAFTHQGVIARYQGSGDQDMYAGVVWGNPGAYNVSIFRNIGGGWAILTSQAAPAAAGTLRLEVVGNSLRLFFNNVLVGNTTDNLIRGPGLVGLRAGGTGQAMDNFSAQPLAATPFSDLFTRGDSDNLGVNYSELLGDMDIVTNRVVVNNAGTNLTTVQNVQEADVSVSAQVTLAGVGSQADLVARYAGPGDTNMYIGRLTNIGGTIFAQIHRNVSGVLTQLVSEAAPASTGVLRFDVQGNSLNLFLNGAPVARATDYMLRSPGLTGMRGTTGVIFDDLNANPLTVGTQATSNVSQNLGTLTPGQIVQTTYRTIVNNPLPADVTQVGHGGTVTGTDSGTGLPYTPVNTNIVNRAVNGAPDLRVGISGPAETMISDIITYTLSYANFGTQDDTNVQLQVAFTLPGIPVNLVVQGGTIFPTGAAAAWNPGSGSTFNLVLGNVPARSSGTVTLILTLNMNPAPSTPINLTAIATLSDNGSQGADLNAADNSRSMFTTLRRPGDP